MLVIRADQLRLLGERSGHRLREGLASQLRREGQNAGYDAAVGRLEVVHAEGGRSVAQFADSAIGLSTPTGREFGLQFDSDNRLAAMVDPAGFRVAFEYDANDCVSTVTRADGATSRLAFDAELQLTTAERPDGRRTRFTRDDGGRLVAVTSPGGNTAQFEYAHSGLPARIVDPSGATTHVEYDVDGQLQSILWPDGRTQAYQAEPDGSVSVSLDGQPRYSIVLDERAGRREIRHADGTWTRVEFEGERLSKVTTESSTLALEYDDAGRLIAEHLDGSTVRYERNRVGAVIRITAPDGRAIDYERDGEQRLRAVVSREAGRVDFEYAPAGPLSRLSYANGVEILRESTAAGMQSGLVVRRDGAESLLGVAWAYDVCDRVVSEAEQGVERRYEYDADGRLCAATDGTGVQQRFELDAVGNRVTDAGVPCRYGANHELLQRNGETYAYDDSGNLQQGGGPLGAVACRWDGRGRLMEVSGPHGTTQYTYDAVGRRVSRTHGDTVTHYTWAGIQLLGETTISSTGTRQREHVIVPELAATLALIDNGIPSFLHHGRRFEPLLATDARGAVVWRAAYDAFGLAHVSVEKVEQPLRLPGQYFDCETGLHYSVRRYYDPEIGRFLSPDPLGFAGGSFNLYAYCDGDPLNRIDPSGEFIPILLAGAAIGAAIGAGVEMYRQHREHPDKPFEWGKIGREALIGGTVGLLGAAVGVAMAPVVGALGSGLAATVAGGGLVGGIGAAVETCADALIRGRALAPGELLHAAVLGATIGAVTAGIGGLWARRARRLARAAEGEAGTAGRAARATHGEAPNPSNCVGEPVDTVSGAVCMWKTDFELPGALPLALKRTYSSALPHSSSVGPRWTCNWTQWVQDEGERATFYGGDGQWVVFERADAESTDWCVHADVPKVRLRRRASGFEVVDAERKTLRFEERVADRWLLSAIEDPNGYRIAFSYDPSGVLRTVEHNGGYFLIVDSTPTQLRRVALRTQDGSSVELVRYEYDEFGRLCGVIDGSGLPFRYRYDADARMTRWEDRRGTWFEYEYDERGRAVRSPGPDGMYDYRFAYDDASRTNTVVDSTGAVSTYRYNERNQVFEKRDARGFVTRTAWDDHSRKLSEIDDAGRGFLWGYDAAGNLSAVRDGLDRLTRFQNNSLGLPEVLTDAAGNFWKRTYDERGNLVTAAGPDGATWTYERDERGNAVRVIDPEGFAREFGYDSRGLLAWSADSKGNRTTLARDDFGRVVEQTDPLGHRTQFAYDALGNLSAATMPDGSQLRWEYDAEGNLTRRIGADGNAYQYRYGVFDLLREVVKPSGGTLRLGYDSEARLTTVTNEIGQRWRYEYNATGQVVGEEDFHGRVQRFEYDASGLCIRRVNGVGEVITFEHDAAGQLVRRLAEGETRYEYDSLGRVVSAVNPDAIVTFERDAYGRVLRDVQNSHVVESAYDRRGLRVKRTTTSHVCEWLWDADGRVSGLRVGDEELLQFVHDAAGRQTERRMRGGLVLRQQFDEMNRLTGQWAGVEGTDSPTRGLVERSYRYNVNGDPAESRDARWGTSRYEYDADGQVVAADRGAKGGERFWYDAAGSISAAYTQTSGAPNQHVSMQFRQERRFGRDGRLARAGDAQFEWDADGRLRRRVQRGRDTRYEWSADGRLTGVLDGVSTRWEYRYDAFGRRLSKEGPMERADYVWDGSVIACEVRPEGPKSWIHLPDSFEPVAELGADSIYECVTDRIGTPTEYFGKGARLEWSGRHTTWGRVDTDTTRSWTSPPRFQGQWHDVETGLHYNYLRYYEPSLGQYLSADPLGLRGGNRAYAYVANPLSWVDPLGLSGCQGTVSTPHGQAAQAQTPEALSALRDVKQGAPLYRQGQLGVQNTADAQFWSLRNPATATNHAAELGMPGGASAAKPDWIMKATLKPGAPVVTRPAPAIGSNQGGAMEAVVPPNSVRIEWFHMP
ncbi:MAG: RHS repeat-associated core domain-containing protein [Vicinamibacterales bacterium]